MSRFIDDDDDKAYWTQIPNIIYDLMLESEEVHIYGHYKRICGAKNGTAREGVRTTAKRTSLSPTVVSRTRRSLVKRGLLVVTSQATPEGIEYIVRITNIWDINKAAFRKFEDSSERIAWASAQIQALARPMPDEFQQDGCSNPSTPPVPIRVHPLFQSEYTWKNHVRRTM